MCSFHLIDFVFQEGQWVWEHSGVPFTYKNWASGYPNGGNCLFMFTDRHGMWFSQGTQIESVNLHKMSNKLSFIMVDQC